MDSQIRQWLPLRKKVELIRNYENNHSISELTNDFKVSQRQITNMVARKAEIELVSNELSRVQEKISTLKLNYFKKNKQT